MRRMLEEQYDIAWELIEANQDKMHAMVDALMKWETIDRDQLQDIMVGVSHVSEGVQPRDVTLEKEPISTGLPSATACDVIM